MLVCGIDEAGRGPCIGPLVICGVLVDEEGEQNLKGIGVKDSKLLTPAKREELFPKIKKIVKKYEIISIPPDEIDMRSIANLNLNQLEALKTSQIINLLKPEKAILDCPSNNIKDYIFQVRKYLNKDVQNIKLIAEHKADEKYVTVGAASILAKVIRDAEIEKLKKEIGIDFGSGYSSDPTTISFLEKYGELLDRFPRLFRQSWDTCKQVKIKKAQKTLSAFSQTNLGMPRTREKDSLKCGLKDGLKDDLKDDLENSTAVFDGITQTDLRKLAKQGFIEVKTKNEHESVRMEGSCTLVLYKTGKLLLQGRARAVEKAKEMIEKVSGKKSD